jgi:hypothetical protein
MNEIMMRPQRMVRRSSRYQPYLVGDYAHPERLHPFYRRMTQPAQGASPQTGFFKMKKTKAQMQDS